MGIKERQDRERQAVRRAILNSARDLFVAEGYDNVSIRKIAEQIEYSPAALYSYFPGKDAIFFALAEEGFLLLARALRDCSEPGDEPIDGIRKLMWHYYKFSRTYPEYYDLMFIDRSVPTITRDWDRFAFVNELMTEVIQLIQRCVEAGQLAPSLNPGAALHIVWAAMHGAATIALSQRLAPGEDADLLARDTLEAVLAGLRAGVDTTFVAHIRDSICCAPATSDGEQTL